MYNEMLKKYPVFIRGVKICFLFIFSLSVLFSYKNVHASSSSFNVTPVTSENQLEGNVGYFNLLMKPLAQQELSFVLNNTTSKSVTIDMSFSRATTNQNGIAVYDSESEEKDNSLKYNIEDYVNIPKKEITLAAHSQEAVKAIVRMPQNASNGVLAGGFSFKEKNVEKHSEASKGVSITNEYRYVIALVIQQNTKTVSPQLNLNEVKAGQVNARNVIEANLQNIAPTYLKNMNVTAKIRGVSQSNLKYTFQNSEMKMAPNSNFDLAVPVSIQGNMTNQTSKALQPGKYHLSMEVYGVKDAEGRYQTTVNGQTVKYEYKWNFERDFEITGEKASKLNRSDPTVHYKEPINWLMIIGIALILIIVLLIFLIFISKRKKDNRK